MASLDWVLLNFNVIKFTGLIKEDIYLAAYLSKCCDQEF